MKSRRVIICFTIYRLLGTAAVTLVQGQPPRVPRPEQSVPRPGQGGDLQQRAASENSLDVVVPRGRPAAISDWALAGIVWSDACLVRKLAQEAAVAVEDDELAADYIALSKQSDELISALEEFGWRRIARSTNINSELAGNQTAAEFRSSRIPDVPGSQPVPPEQPEQPIRRRPREVGGATLLPVDGPIQLDLYQRNFRLEGAGYAEPEILSPLEKGMEEAIAASGILRSAEFGDGDGRISYRESQTRSNSMPYSYESIYNMDDYDPGVDYRAEMYGFEDREERVDADAEGTTELNFVQVEPAKLLDRLAGVSELKHYTQQVGRYKQDSNWVQLHLNLNQMMWLNLAETGEWPVALQLARLKLANTAKVANTITSNQRLQAILEKTP